jgi:hypothetical protein
MLKKLFLPMFLVLSTTTALANNHQNSNTNLELSAHNNVTNCKWVTTEVVKVPNCPDGYITKQAYRCN